MDYNKLTNQLRKHEGIRHKVYVDTTGHRTIGIGFNLERMDAPAIVKSVGADYKDVVSGDYVLSYEQVGMLLSHDLKDIESQAETLIDNWQELSDVRQRVIVDMIFNLGYEGFRKFKNTRKHIMNGDFDKAASNMMQSLWAKQVKGRARILASMMRDNEDIYDL